jgi:EmrB/QacA subfamily drug resistance transporter
MTGSAESTGATAAPRPTGGLSQGRIAGISLAVLLTMLLSILDQNIVTTAAWPIIRDLDPSRGLEDLPWLVTVYLLAMTVTLPLYGKLTDRFGPKPLYLTSVGLFIVGSALCGLAWSMPVLIAFRGLQGLGGGGLVSTAVVIAASLAPPKKRAGFAGLAGTLVAVGLILGPLAGGYLTQHWSWRWVFYVNLPIGVVSWLVIAVLLPGVKQARPGSTDFAGAGLIAIASSALLLACTWGGDTYAWSSTPMISLIAGGALALSLFVWRETKAAEPIFPFGLFRDGVFRAASPLQFITGFAFAGSIIYLVLYMQVARGVAPQRSGVLLLPMALGIATASILTGWLIGRFGRYKVFLITGTTLVTIAMWLFSRLTVDSTTTTLSIDLFITGLGFGQVLQIAMLAVQNSVPEEHTGAALTSIRFSQQLGSSLGTAIFGTILSRTFAWKLDGTGLAHVSANQAASVIPTLTGALRTAVLHAFVFSLDRVFLVGAGTLVVGVALAIWLPNRPLRTGDEADDASPDAADDTIQPRQAARTES